MTSRRCFLAVAAASPLLVVSRLIVAQQPRVHRIGILRPTAPGGDETMTGGMKRALSDLGYVEGQNLAVDVRFADNKLNRLPALAQ